MIWFSKLQVTIFQMATCETQRFNTTYTGAFSILSRIIPIPRIDTYSDMDKGGLSNKWREKRARPKLNWVGFKE